MASYRILVTGSRTWDDEEMVRIALRTENENFNTEHWPVVLVHGGARGLDTIAARVATDFGWRVEKHPAQWNTHDTNCPDWHFENEGYCKMAGHRRNAEMVASRADVCIAFIRNGSPGATGCAKLAAAAGIPTKRILLED